MNPSSPTLPLLATRILGRALAVAVSGLAHVRPADKVMHPRGVVRTAVLRRDGGGPSSGAAFLDAQGEDAVLVRLSRSIGFPAPLPDVDGMALRIFDESGGHADLLMSTTGAGRLTRFALMPTTRAVGRFQSTLLPHRAPTGPVLIAARATNVDCWELLWARPRGSWIRFGDLEVSAEPGSDFPISFDPVGAAPPGLAVYDWHRRLRGPSYDASRRSRTTSAPARTTAPR